jgi:hypothetical protein
MSVNGIDELPAYLDFMRTHPARPARCSRTC